MELKCQQGKDGCKYCGDLFEICTEYCKGSSENGEPIYSRLDYPHYCRDCKDRDFDFCLRYTDLICFNEQDPFDCRADLENDEFYGTELIRKTHDATKRAFLKRNLLYEEPWKH